MSYTTQEIAAAVEKLVRTSIRRTQGTLGNREVGVTFNDYQDAAAGTYLLFQNAPFYTVYLAAQNLKVALGIQQEAIGEFINVVEATDRRVTPIKNLSPLANARVALDGMLLAAASRTGTFNSIDEVPAYQRFDSNTQQFLDESSRNIRSDGSIVRTPGEARGLLSPYYRTLRAAHGDVIRRVELLEGAINDFNSLDLPVSLIQSILENARNSLQNWYVTLQGLPEQDRLKIIRDATLDILAARSTVSGFGSLRGATMFVPLDGAGQVFADSSHPAAPAEVSSTELGPYIISEEAPFITLEVEGDALAIEVQGSFVAASEATLYGPFVIGHPNVMGPGGVNNNTLLIQMLNRLTWGGTEDMFVEFPEVGATYETWEVAGFINYSIPSAVPLICEPYTNPFKFGGGCNITWDGGNSWFELESINTSTDFGALGLKEGGYILVPPQSPASLSHNAIYQIRSGGIATTTLFCDLVFHPGGLSGAALDELAIDVRITDDALPLRLRITGANDKAASWDLTTWSQPAKADAREDALTNRWGFGLPVAGASSGARVVTDVDIPAVVGLPADVVGDLMTIVVDGTSQPIDLTGFVGTTIASLASEIDSQMTVGNCTVKDGTFLRFRSPTAGEDSSVSLTAGNLLDDLFVAGEAGAPYSGVGSEADALQFNSTTNLGFYSGIEVLCRRTTAEVIANNVTNSPAAAVLKEPRVEAETFFSPTYYSGRGRTDPFDFLKLIATIFEADSLTATLGVPGVYTFAVEGAETAGVTTAHKLVIRASDDPDDIGRVADILSVSDTEVEADFSYTLQGTLTDLDIEVGPDLSYPSVIGHAATAVVANGPANDGAYGVLDVGGSIPFELELDKPVPFSSGAANQPIYFDLEVGRYGVTFRSLDTTLATYLEVDDNGGDPSSASGRFFTSLPTGGPGSTTYFQLPEWNRALNEGDTLELYTTQFDSPAVVSPIVGLEDTNLLIELDTPLDSNTPAFSFGLDVPVPFARIRNNRMNNYTDMQGLLETWLGMAANTAWYFPELQRLLNPLTVNTNPTADQVGDAKNHLEVLGSTLEVLDGILADYSADVVPQVDVLLSSLQEKGADRARDILLEAQFSTFFSMNMDETSYSGSVQAKLKEVNREDLPVRKDNRTGASSGKEELIGQYEEKDYEYDISDLDEGEELDIPAGSTY
jgi:hypothetical protein